jgi:hypothetical protein
MSVFRRLLTTNDKISEGVTRESRMLPRNILGVLQALAWTRNTLWARLPLSVLRLSQFSYEVSNLQDWGHWCTTGIYCYCLFFTLSFFVWLFFVLSVLFFCLVLGLLDNPAVDALVYSMSPRLRSAPTSFPTSFPPTKLDHFRGLRPFRASPDFFPVPTAKHNYLSSRALTPRPFLSILVFLGKAPQLLLLQGLCLSCHLSPALATRPGHQSASTILMKTSVWEWRKVIIPQLWLCFSYRWDENSKYLNCGHQRPPEIIRELTWTRTQASTMTIRQLTTWMARPIITLNHFSATMTQIMWCEENHCNVSVLKRVHLYNLVCLAAGNFSPLK